MLATEMNDANILTPELLREAIKEKVLNKIEEASLIVAKTAQDDKSSKEAIERALTLNKTLIDIKQKCCKFIMTLENDNDGQQGLLLRGQKFFIALSGALALMRARLDALIKDVHLQENFSVEQFFLQIKGLAYNLDEGLTNFSKNGKIRLLLADDTSIHRKMASRTLMSFQFKKVSVFHDGQQALDAFQKEPGTYDVLFLDNQMPNKTGLEVIQEVRGTNQKIAIISWTSEDKEKKEDLERAGADKVIPKNALPKDMQEAISSAIFERRQKFERTEEGRRFHVGGPPR